MRAIYNGRLAQVTDDTGDGLVLDGELLVKFADPGLIVDPTDEQVAAAEAGEDIPDDPEEAASIAAILDQFGLGSMKDEVEALRASHYPMRRK